MGSPWLIRVSDKEPVSGITDIAPIAEDFSSL